MNIIMKSVYGSRLYGTENENSDWDFKGIYLPSLENAICNNIKNVITLNTNNSTKNSKDDIDNTFYSLQYFMQMVAKSQPVALEMLFSDNLFSSKEWDIIKNYRNVLLSKNINPFMGFAINQSNKYMDKANKCKGLLKLVEFFNSLTKDCNIIKRISYYWNDLPVINGLSNFDGDFYVVLGSKYHKNNVVEYVFKCINEKYKKYGKRVNEAVNNENIDWKSIYHAARVCYEAEMILKERKLEFPLPNPIKNFLKNIKEGNFKLEIVMNFLENYYETLKNDIERSTLPERIDDDIINNIILKVYKFKYKI